MKITLFQSDIEWESPSKNIAKIDAVLNRCGSCDLFVLPEMFATGFCTKPQGVAESTDGESLQWMRQTARKKNCAIAGSLAIEENGRFYNRFYFVRPDGEQYYDKHHLFTCGGEHLNYTRGEERVVVHFRGARILLQICYDLRFPTFARNHGDYDLILYSANWSQQRQHAWETLLKARAIENQCYVAGINRVGKDIWDEYKGGTMLVDAFGNEVVKCGYNQESFVNSELDLETLNKFRHEFPVLDDAE